MKDDSEYPVISPYYLNEKMESLKIIAKRHKEKFEGTEREEFSEAYVNGILLSVALVEECFLRTNKELDEEDK